MDRHVGLERRTLEREVRWMMRHLPEEPDALAKLLCEVIVTLIDKNNKALAASLGDEADEGSP